MSGIHQFTSSQWIQSGSEAQFKTGINVTGSITASGTITAGTFVGDGSNLTGIGDEDFFVGNPSEITDGTPSSKDTVFDLPSGQNTASANQVVIATTHSANFIPNYYSFYKLTDQGFETIQSGSLSYYSGSDRTGNDTNGADPFDNDLAPGVHRYMVNAVNTGSGVGHSLFTTITIASFVNRPPELSLPTNLTFQIPHNSNQGSITFELTESSDPNEDVDDFIRRFEATRSGVDPTTDHTYNLEITNGNSTGQEIITQSHEIAAGSTALSNTGLSFTANFSNYSVLNGNSVQPNQADRSETFNVKIYDNNLERNTDSGSFTLTVQAPPTASISIRTEVENSSYTNTITNDYTTTMLYDRATVPTSKDGLADIYTSSLVRIRTCADIISPPGFTPSSGVKTRAKIFKANDHLTDKTDTFVHWVQFNGYNGTAYTASAFSTAESDFDDNSPSTTATATSGWIGLPLGPTSAKHFGPIHNDANLLDITEGIRYGSYNHFSASSVGQAPEITVNSIPDVQIDSIKVQIESSSFSEVAGYSRTGSILYGHQQTLLQENTASLIGETKQIQYISESVIRYRVLAKITEPFGPDHKTTRVDIRKNGTAIHELQFNTSSAYHSSNALDGSQRRVAHYTSSWQSSSFSPGTFALSASFTSSAANAGQTVTSGQYSSLLINPTASTQIDSIEVELETAYGTEAATHERTSRILYGFTSSLRSTETASLLGYTKENEYISESVIRYRVRAKVVEPFGPETTDITSSVDLVTGYTTISPTKITGMASDATNKSYASASNGLYSNPSYPAWEAVDNSTSYGSWWQGMYDNNDLNNVGHSQDTFWQYDFGTFLGFNPVIEKVIVDPYSDDGHRQIEVSGSNNGTSWTGIYKEPSARAGGSSNVTLQWSNSTSYRYYRLTFRAGLYDDGGNDYFRIAEMSWFTSSVIAPVSENILLTTSSADVQSSGSETFNTNHQRILNYTSSWQEHNFDNNIDLSSSFSTTENSLSITPGVTSSLTMSATEATIIQSTMSYEDKWSGETPSGIETAARSARILYGYSDTFKVSETASLRSQVNYRATHSTDAVIRHRIRAKVVEPFGPNTTEITIDPIFGNNITISTASAQMVYTGSHENYDSNNRKIFHYTSSWEHDDYLSGVNQQQTYTVASTDNGLNSSKESPPTVTVTSPSNPTITAVVEVEQAPSGSGNAGSTRTATFVHGRSQDTVTDPAIQSGWPPTAQNEMVRARVRAHVQETFGPKADTFSANLTNGAGKVQNTVTTPLSSGSGVNHSETNGSFAYEFTGAFEPIQLTSTGENGIEINDFSDTFTSTQPSTAKTSATVTMNARQTSSIAFVSLVASSDFSSSTGVTMTHPYVVPGYVSEKEDLGITATTTHTPPPISIYSSLSDAQSSVTYEVTSITYADKASTNTDGRNGHVDFTSIDTYPGPQSITVTGTVTADGSITGDTTSDTNTVTVICLPQPPKSFEGKYFAAYDASAHDDDNSTYVDLKNGKLFVGILPSSSAWTYKSGDSPGDSISNVFIVNDTNGTNTDYSIELNLLNNTFGQGDKGRLIIKLNGVETASFDLTGSFNTPNGNFTPSTAIGSSANSGLFISSWKGTGGFSFYDGTEFFPYGYRGLNGVFNLDYKVRNGYNYLQIIKTSGSVSESMVPFEWYYDDYDTESFRNAATYWSWSPYNGSNPTMSLSGVSYFKNNVDFEISYSGFIINLANDTYQSVSDLGTVTMPANGLEIRENGTWASSKPIDPGDTLFWSSHDATDSSIPEIGATASLAYRARYVGTSTDENVVISSVQVKRRDLSSGTNNSSTFLSIPSVGRFVNDSIITSTSDNDTVAYFYEETRRIPKSQTSSFNSNPSSLGGSNHNYTYWLTASNCIYDSTQSLTTNKELQQTIAGHLIYPTENYTSSTAATDIVNPNAPDYTSASGDRYWYRAFEVDGFTENTTFLRLLIGVDASNPITRSDIWAQDTTGNFNTEQFDSRKIRIRFKFPGPITSNFPDESLPGTKWGALCGGYGVSNSPLVDNWFLSSGAQFYPRNTNTTLAGVGAYNPGTDHIAIRINPGSWGPILSSGIVLIEVRMKDTATGVDNIIENLKIEPWS